MACGEVAIRRRFERSGARATGREAAGWGTSIGCSPTSVPWRAEATITRSSPATGTSTTCPTAETWSSPELLYEIGRAFGMLGNEDKVERYLLRCADLAPRRAAVFHCAIGWYFQRKKKWTKALRWYDRALQSFPTYHLCLFRRGLLPGEAPSASRGRRRSTRARDVWEQAGPEQRMRGRGVSRSRCSSISRACCATSASSIAQPEALDACRVLDGETDPPAIRPEHLLACRAELLLRRRTIPSGARALFEEARELDPTSSYVWERLGRVHELLGDHDDAEAAYRRAVALPRGALRAPVARPLPPERDRNLAQAAAPSLTALRDVRARNRSFASRSRGCTSHANGRTAAYEQVAQALACRREGGFAEGLRLAADLAERLGRPDEAATHLRQLARIAPDDAEIARRAELLADARLGGSATSRSAAPRAGRAPLRRLRSSTSAGATACTGIVDRFFAEKGFGFVRYGEGQTLFFHVTQCPDGVTRIEPGTTVSFIVGHNPKKGKPQAEAIRFGD